MITKDTSLPIPDYQALFESAPGNYLAITKDYIIIAISNCYLKAINKQRDELLGRNIFDIFKEIYLEEIDNLKESLENVVENQTPHIMPIQKRSVKLDNSISNCYWKRSHFSIMDKQGNIAYIIQQMEDITNITILTEKSTCITENKELIRINKELKETTNKLKDVRLHLKNIINHVADPIFVKDKQHRWIDGNTAFLNLMGKPENEVFGKSDYDFFPKEQADIFWEKDEEVFKSGKENINIEYLTDLNGKTHILSTKKTCFQTIDNDLILVGIIRDITEITSMQKQLKESGQAYLRGIIDNSLDAIITMDQQGLITEWNRQAEKIFGWTYQEAIGKQMAEMIIPPEYRKQHYEGMQKFLQDGRGNILNRRIEFTGINKHGDILPIELSVIAQKQFDSYYFTAFIRDITVSKQTEKLKGLLAAIVEFSDDAIISKTLDNKITSWNVGAEELFGYKAEEIIGKNFYILIPEELQEEEKEIIRKVNAGQPIKNFETKRLHKDGHPIDVSITTSPIFDNSDKIIGYSKLARDITDRKKSELQLINYTSALERSNKELDDFAYIASHDLKEPLRGINNYSQFLLEDNEDKLDAESVSRLKRLIYLSHRMENLVNDLLYFSRLGRQELAIQQTDMNIIIKDVEATLDIFLKENNAHIIIPNPLPIITCDKIRVTEAFNNLITNAVKYNDSQEKIIEIGFFNKFISENKKEIRNVFYVRDNGRGIQKKFYNEIFRIFKRLQTSKNEDGTGVGLTFVKKIIERHGGDIWLDSQLGKSTTFYFTLEDKTNATKKNA